MRTGPAYLCSWTGPSTFLREGDAKPALPILSAIHKQKRPAERRFAEQPLAAIGLRSVTTAGKAHKLVDKLYIRLHDAHKNPSDVLDTSAEVLLLQP